jgi:WD40 repeat protein
VQVWDLLTHGRLGDPLRLPSQINWAELSQDARTIAIASDDGTVVVRTGETYQTIATQFKLERGDTGGGFSPDGTILAESCGGWIFLWDTRSWAKLKEVEAYDKQILALGFSPDGRRLFTMAYDRPVKIWDVAAGQALGQPIEAERPFAYFQVSPDGKRLATRSQSGVVRLWDAFTGLPVSEPFEHEGPITGLRFDPNGQFIITTSQDGTAQVWDVQEAGQPTALILKTTDTYPSACFSQDGRLVVRTTDRQAEVFDIQTGERIGKPMAHSGEIYRLKLSPDGKKLATAGWELDRGTSTSQFPCLPCARIHIGAGNCG